ncbi:MAG: cytochrome b561 [Patescibacteria group bacterium]|nr:MAG: cytochrome b561 [Patescibacteria group bacterium]
MKEYIYSFVDFIINSQYADLGLFLTAFAESSFFPIPPDTLLIPLALLNPEKALFLSFLTTIASVLGGGFGYFIGYKGGRPIVSRFVSDEKLYKVKQLYNKYDVWAVGIAAFTPIPYKVFTIAAGLFELDFKRFIIASVLGRGGRFMLIGLGIHLFGPAIKPFLTSNLEVFTIGFVVLLVFGFWAINMFLKRQSHSDSLKQEKF